MAFVSPINPHAAAPELCWVDPKGGLFFQQKERVAKNPNTPFPKRARRFPFEKMCMVRLRRQGAAIEVSWDVDTATTASLWQASRMAANCGGVSHVVLRFRKTGWSNEVVEQEVVTNRILEIAQFQGINILPRTTVQREEISDASNGDGLLREMFQFWRSGGDMSESRFADHLIDLARDPAGDVCFRHIGCSTPLRGLVGQESAESLIGQTTVDDFGSEYEREVCASYTKALDEERPRYEHVRGLIHSDGDLEWLRYERLLLPWQGGLLSATAFRNDIVGFLHHPG